VLSAVDLDDELRVGAEEVDDARTNRLLAPEAKAIELLAAQTGPEADFGVGRGAPELAREGRGQGRLCWHR